MTTENIKTEYLAIREKALRFRDAILIQLEHLLNSNSITLAVPLEGRIKEWDSVEEKISRKSLDLRTIEDVDDLIGIRVILLFRRDLPLTDDLLRKNLVIDHAENAADRLSEAQFGYQSQHYSTRLPKAWLSIPSYAEFSGLRAEIQLRTVAQHIWAASSHKLQYKHESSVPPPLRRAIYRVSALLETVDLEFDRLLAEREVYVQQDREDVTIDEQLNVDVLERILTEMLPPENKAHDETYADLLVDLLHFHINTESELRSILKDQMAVVLEAEAGAAAEKGLPKYFKHVGLARQALRSHLGNDALNNFHLDKKSK